MCVIVVFDQMMKSLVELVESKFQMSTKVKAVGTDAATAPLKEMTITRREPKELDVEMELLFCGVCHSDIHTARNEWMNTTYPCIPGHEMIGRVTRVGSKVTSFKVGDLGAVGCLVDSCRTCEPCKDSLEQFCTSGCVPTYNGVDKHLGGCTFGGYSTSIVVDQAFVLHVPEGMDLPSAAPLLCAGITTYSPMRKWKVGPGQKVGVVGLGGLGHMGVKFARAFGAHVVLFTSSKGKVEDGLRLGAHEVVISKDPEAMKRHEKTFNFILDTVSAEHDVGVYLNMLKLDGTVCIVGAPTVPFKVGAFDMFFPRRNLSGSVIGGIAETQEMLNFCAKNKISCDIEMIPASKINEAYDRMVKQDVKYRFVIDLASLKQ